MAGGIGDALESGADLLLVDVVGVVGAAVPRAHLLLAAAALALVGAGDGVEELVVAGQAAGAKRNRSSGDTRSEQESNLHGDLITAAALFSSPYDLINCALKPSLFRPIFL